MPDMPQKRVRHGKLAQIEIPPQRHKKLKHFAVEHETTIQQILTQALDNWLRDNGLEDPPQLRREATSV